MATKYQVSGKGIPVSIAEADRIYAEKKAAAEHATQADFVKFLLEHDGKPSQDFVSKLRASPEERNYYVTCLEGLFKDPGYADDFFGCTGKRLNVALGHAKAWAEAIAEEVLNQIPTLQ